MGPRSCGSGSSALRLRIWAMWAISWRAMSWQTSSRVKSPPRGSVIVRSHSGLPQPCSRSTVRRRTRAKASSASCSVRSRPAPSAPPPSWPGVERSSDVGGHLPVQVNMPDQAVDLRAGLDQVCDQAAQRGKGGPVSVPKASFVQPVGQIADPLRDRSHQKHHVARRHLLLELHGFKRAT